MGTALFRALALTVVLTAVAPVPPAEASTADPNAGAAAAPATAVESAGDGGSALQRLSILGALGLGIVGLLWLRRHTTDL